MSCTPTKLKDKDISHIVYREASETRTKGANKALESGRSADLGRALHRISDMNDG